MPTLPRRVSRRPLAFAVPSYTLDEVIAMLQQFQARPGDFVAIAWVIDEMLKRLAPTAGRRLVRRAGTRT